MQSLPNHSNAHEVGSEINIKELFLRYLLYWKWYLFSILLLVIGVTFYLRYTIPQYGVVSSVLIKDEKKGGASELSAFSDLNIFSTFRSNVSNEIIILKSRSLSQKVVKELKLDFSYFVEGRLIKVELYKDLPFQLNFVNPKVNFDAIDTTFVFRPISKNTFAFLNSQKKKLQFIAMAKK